MSKIDRYKKKKENREAFKEIRRRANKRAERDRIEFAKTRKANPTPIPDSPDIPNA